MGLCGKRESGRDHRHRFLVVVRARAPLRGFPKKSARKSIPRGVLVSRVIYAVLFLCKKKQRNWSIHIIGERVRFFYTSFAFSTSTPPKAESRENRIQQYRTLTFEQETRNLCSFGLFNYDSYESFRAMDLIWGISKLTAELVCLPVWSPRLVQALSLIHI